MHTITHREIKDLVIAHLNKINMSLSKNITDEHVTLYNPQTNSLADLFAVFELFERKNDGKNVLYYLNMATYELGILDDKSINIPVTDVWGIECGRVVLLGCVPTLGRTTNEIYDYMFNTGAIELRDIVGCYGTMKEIHGVEYRYLHNMMPVFNSRCDAVTYMENKYKHDVWAISADGTSPWCIHHGYAESWDDVVGELICGNSLIRVDQTQSIQITCNGHQLFRSKSDAEDYLYSSTKYRLYGFEPDGNSVVCIGDMRADSVYSAIHKLSHFVPDLQFIWDNFENLSDIQNEYLSGRWKYKHHPVFTTLDDAREYATAKTPKISVFAKIFK